MDRIKKIISVLILLSVSNVIRSQKLGLTFGAGYNTEVKSAKQIFPVSYYYYNRPTPYLGIIYRDTLNKYFSLRTSLYYVQRGIRYLYDFQSPVYNLKVDQIFTCHYLSFPLIFNFNYKNFYIGGGVEGSILLKGHYDFTTISSDPTGYYQKQVSNKWYGGQDKVFNPVDAGFRFNLGYRKGNFEIEANMFHGLIPPATFFVFTSQHFEFQYLTQQTFMLGVNYYPKFKRRKNK
ncbi:MAG: outer membrane beta-barrel protein [Bacteroidetes bacterium]|nr:outer membrane beta-barrel protein [Bacteroidota bacterium]